MHGSKLLHDTESCEWTEVSSFDQPSANTDNLKCHILSKGGEHLYICALCGKHCRLKSILDCHLRTHTGERPFMCRFCGKDFAQKATLNYHMTSHSDKRPHRFAGSNFLHDTESYKWTEVSSFDQPSPNANNLKCHILSKGGEHLYICGLCGKDFRQKSNLDNHMRTHTGERPFRCRFCGKDFAQKATLNYHMTRHSDERPHKFAGNNFLHETVSCERSEVSSFDQSSPNTHNLKCHISSKRRNRLYICGLCGKDFQQKSNLDNHMRIHTGERPFKCKFCGKGFAQKSTLNYHLTRHSDERPHICKLCGKGFKRNKILTKGAGNNFLHETESYEQPEVSSFDRSSPNTDNLKCHILSKREHLYICGLCGKDFRHKSSLDSHMRTHTGERPFKCRFCGKGFAHRATLNNHITRHSDERPHKCQLCGKGFKRKDGLKSHMVSHLEK
ncbi:zinc finger protein 227-like [Argiope bruennichi]|uniref:zinc finger protein 227-like n=1 Tax=Argiope bruennichi TaxID=94029 RepID=UPI002495406D|nr:zinc finger protein 227-like [Argiope bruennichi]